MNDQDKASRPDAENPEWTDDMVANAKRLDDLPATLQAKLRGRPVAENPKVSVTLRLDPDVIAFFKASGAGWQTRINTALRREIGK